MSLSLHGPWAWWHSRGHGRGCPTQALLHVLPCRSSAFLGPGGLGLGFLRFGVNEGERLIHHCHRCERTFKIQDPFIGSWPVLLFITKLSTHLPPPPCTNDTFSSSTFRHHQHQPQERSMTIHDLPQQPRHLCSDCRWPHGIAAGRTKRSAREVPSHMQGKHTVQLFVL